jgi:hypothetical protein
MRKDIWICITACFFWNAKLNIASCKAQAQKQCDNNPLSVEKLIFVLSVWSALFSLPSRLRHKAWLTTMPFLSIEISRPPPVPRLQRDRKGYRCEGKR